MALPEYAPALAAEVGRGLFTKQDICGFFSIPETVLDGLLNDPAFQQLCIENHIKYHAGENILQRIRDKSTIAIERSIEVLYKGIADTNTPVSLRQSYLQKLQELAKLDVATQTKSMEANPALAGGGGPVLHININMPNRTIQVQSPKIPTTIEGDVQMISDQVPADLGDD